MKISTLILALVFSGLLSAEESKLTPQSEALFAHEVTGIPQCPEHLPVAAHCHEMRCGQMCFWSDASGGQQFCRNYGC